MLYQHIHKVGLGADLVYSCYKMVWQIFMICY